MAGVDRISELPEPILHHILSSLSQKEAIQTSALSKTWRHVGPTRPKIELREHWFQKSGDASLLSVLGKTLQRYNHQNLSVHEIILSMSWESEFWNLNHQQLITDQPLFKGLKRLSLINAHIKDEATLEKIMRSCPVIEYLKVSRCVGFPTIPETIFQAEFLTELHLTGRKFNVYGHINLKVTTDQQLLIKRLKTLSLDRVYIAEETLDKIMCGCPFIESLLLTHCKGLTNIRLIKNNNNLKHFSVSFFGEKTESLAIHSPAIETISIVKCPNWYGRDKYFFPRLKSLYLYKVKLSGEFFESFSFNFPSLKELKLEYCYGLEEIQLTACLIKRLIINTDSEKPIKATIYAPKIHYFKFCGRCPPKIIFTSKTTGGEWKSHVEIWYDNYSDNKDLELLWFIQLSILLNSLRESQISLVVYRNHFKNLKVENTYDAVFCNPVPLEDLHVKGGCESCSFPDLLNCLFLICRPRYIRMDFYTFDPDLKYEKDKLVELITFKTIQNKGEMSRGYLWERDLEDLSIRVWDGKGWHTVGIEGTSFPGISFPGFTTCYPEIRFSVKWRD